MKKQAAMAEFHQDFAQLKSQWGGYAGYDAWVARANNATFGLQAAYDDLVPAFEALFAQQGNHFPRFYEAVRGLAALPKDQRHRRLRTLLAHHSPTEPTHFLSAPKSAQHGRHPDSP